MCILRILKKEKFENKEKVWVKITTALNGRESNVEKKDIMEKCRVTIHSMFLCGIYCIVIVNASDA